VDTSRSENENRLVAGTDCLGCGAERLAPAVWDARFGRIACAGLGTVDKDNLLPVPNTDGEGARSAVQHRIGPIVELLQLRDGAHAPGRRARGPLGARPYFVC
jgi:hypothetical protein